jgi:hypothetical protein
MRSHGLKVLDPGVESLQLEWLVISVDKCPDTAAEEHLASRHFRTPHEAWAPQRAFVAPVTVRSSRRRKLFCQLSGVNL